MSLFHPWFRIASALAPGRSCRKEIVSEGRGRGDSRHVKIAWLTGAFDGEAWYCDDKVVKDVVRKLTGSLANGG